MKKIFVAASFLALSLGAFAQDNAEKSTEGFVSKNGHQVLPQAGDWSVSFDAVPVFEYFGNAFNQNGTGSTNTISAGFPSGIPAITGKYFVDANTAYRVRMRIGLQNSTEKTNVLKSGSTTDYVENKVTTKSTDVYLSGGIEKRKGSSRVQGIYGAELIFAINSNPNVKYEYGNAIANFASRTLEEKKGNTLSVGPRAFVGAEYFFAPKFSVGAEFGWAILFSKTGGSETTTESNDGTSTTTTTTPSTTTGGAGSGTTRLDTDNFGGSINLNFYF